MKKLYIISFYEDDCSVDRDFEWFWAENEDQAMQDCRNYMRELGREIDKDADFIIDCFEVEIPNELVKEIEDKAIEKFKTETLEALNKR